MANSKVLQTGSSDDLDSENATLRSPSGEELRLRELKDPDNWSAIGFRHQIPDNDGRLWRTEGVLKHFAAENKQDLIRLRTECIANRPGARLEFPRKPYLIKALLGSKWGGTDSQLTVSDQPLWLTHSENDIAIAKAIILGSASKFLPIVYISAIELGKWLLDREKIEKLAYDLGGIAHIVVEPDRSFSFDLRDKTEGRNAYGGTIGLSVPDQGIVRRHYLGWQIQDRLELAAATKAAVTNLRSQMPAFGWDWTELQEQALRAQRARDTSRLTSEENEQLYLEEIENLQDKIRQLEQQINARPTDPVGTDAGEFSNENLVRLIGPEVYSGEVSDRLRLAAKIALNAADNIGLDTRSMKILRRVVDRIPVSPALGELSQDLTRATKDPNRIAGELVSLLSRHGYVEKSENRHIRMEADSGFEGLDSITLPKTPSENRGLSNLRKQIERTLGITKLKF